MCFWTTTATKGETRRRELARQTSRRPKQGIVRIGSCGRRLGRRLQSTTATATVTATAASERGRLPAEEQVERLLSSSFLLDGRPDPRPSREENNECVRPLEKNDDKSSSLSPSLRRVCLRGFASERGKSRFFLEKQKLNYPLATTTSGRGRGRRRRGLSVGRERPETIVSVLSKPSVGLFLWSWAFIRPPRSQFCSRVWKVEN